MTQAKRIFISLFLIFSFIIQIQVYGQTELKILNYNVWDGFKRYNVSDTLNQNIFIEWVKNISPDIIAYQEMCFISQDDFEDFATKLNHNYAILSNPFKTLKKDFPVALTSKYPIVNVRKVEDNMHHAYLYAKIKDIHLFVIHLSPFSLEKRINEIDQILAEAALLPKKENIMIMGDFNSLSADDSLYYKNLKVNQIKEIRGNPDYSVINKMKNSGYYDVFRIFHKEFAKSMPTEVADSILTSLSRPSVPRRIDYVFVNKVLAKKLISADFLIDSTTNKISDHYPLLITVRLNR